MMGDDDLKTISSLTLFWIAAAYVTQYHGDTKAAAIKIKCETIFKRLNQQYKICETTIGIIRKHSDVNGDERPLILINSLLKDAEANFPLIHLENQANVGVAAASARMPHTPSRKPDHPRVDAHLTLKSSQMSPQIAVLIALGLTLAALGGVGLIVAGSCSLMGSPMALSMFKTPVTAVAGIVGGGVLTLASAGIMGKVRHTLVEAISASSHRH